MTGDSKSWHTPTPESASPLYSSPYVLLEEPIALDRTCLPPAERHCCLREGLSIVVSWATESYTVLLI